MKPAVFLPRLGTQLSPLGFGCCPMGLHAWGRVEETALVDAVEKALDLGVSFFDTADIYGLGASEELLGRALGRRRSSALVATKFGVRRTNGQTVRDTSPAWINEALDASLRRLGTDYIDLYQMHYWDGRTSLDEIAEVLEGLIAKGKIRAYGVTNFDPRQIPLRRHSSPLSYSYQYSLVHRTHESQILTTQRETDYVFLSWGTLGQGVLSGKYTTLDQLELDDRRRRMVYENFHGEKFAAIQTLVREMKTIAKDVGAGSVTRLALRWVIDHLPRSVALVGIKRPDQIIDAAGALDFQLDATSRMRLDELTSSFTIASSSSSHE